MSWAKLSDKLWSHPKMVALPAPALRLWLFALSWAAGHETDGHIPRAILPIIGGTAKLAAVLVTARLWETAADGWQVHDYAVYNPTRAQLDEKRLATAERVAAFRARPRSPGNGVTGPPGNAVTNANSNATRNTVGNTSPDPTRTDPNQKTVDQDLSGAQPPPPPMAAAPPTTGKNPVETASDDRERPMPLDWSPHPEAVSSLAASLRVSVAKVSAAADEFRAYWTIGGGMGKPRRNWQAAFREHCRRMAAQGTLGAPVGVPMRRPDRLAEQRAADVGGGYDALAALRAADQPDRRRAAE